MTETYWWDFRDDKIIVQSTRQDKLAEFSEISEAEEFIKQLNLGWIRLNSDGTVKN